MEGGYDPDNRRCVDWRPEAWDHALLAFYKQMTAWRKTDDRLRRGSIAILPHASLLIIERALEGRTVRIVINHQDHPEPYGCEGVDHLVGAFDWIKIDFDR
ncbi:MAG: hypothetical protein MZU97_10155 [Bacillus subtilis]|nr:hypothetical protein [Bacillus subtilis]